MVELVDCQICKREVQEHLRCDGCFIYAGSGHITGRLKNINGHQFCWSCYARFIKLEKRKRIMTNNPYESLLLHEFVSPPIIINSSGNYVWIDQKKQKKVVVNV